MSKFLTLTESDIPLTGEGFAPLEDDVYQAACAGIIVKEMQNYDKTGLEQKIIMVFQIPTDDGKFRYLQSRPMKKSLHEKSGFWKLLSKWTKQKDPKTLIEKMGTDGKFDIEFFIGKPIQLDVVSEVVGDKTYNRIDAYLSPKKGAAGVVADITVPAFMIKDAVEYKWADGIAVQATKADDTVATPPVDLSNFAVDTNADNSSEDDLPF